MIGDRLLLAVALLVVAGRAGAPPRSSPPPAGPKWSAALQAADRPAPTAPDVAVIRAGLGSPDDQTRRIALRALGRLERPPLIADIVPALKAMLPEIRAEAANAIGQAAQGWK